MRYRKLWACFCLAAFAFALSACSPQGSNPSADLSQSLEPLLGKNRQEVAAALGGDLKMPGQQTEASGAALTLDGFFDYQGKQAAVELSFINNYMYSVRYIFDGANDAQQDATGYRSAGYAYAKNLLDSFTQKYGEPDRTPNWTRYIGQLQSEADWKHHTEAGVSYRETWKTDATGEFVSAMFGEELAARLNHELWLTLSLSDLSSNGREISEVVLSLGSKGTGR